MQLNAVKIIAYILIALTSVFTLMHYATQGRVAYTMDSLSYRDSALNFISGHPSQTTNVITPSPEKLPLVIWPPAYPAFWASATQLLDIDIDDVPSYLNPLLLAITTLAILWVCWIVTGNLALSSLIAAVNAFTPSSMIVFGHAWSETLFIPLLILAYGSLWKYLRTDGNIFWLTNAAVLIGLINWVRYAGVSFFPVFGISVLLLSKGNAKKRILHTVGSTLLATALATPLWFRNWQLTGNLSGSVRGGSPYTTRWIEDTASIFDLFEHSFFSFSILLRAHLEIPIAVAVLFVVIKIIRRYGLNWLKRPETWLPLIWLIGYLGFLLFARSTQREVPMDLRMLAAAFPFILFTLSPAINKVFSENTISTEKILSILLLGLLINSGICEAQRTRDNYVSANVPRWRSAFGLAFRDLRKTSPTSRALLESIGLVTPTTIIVTDYRALYIQYLTGAKVYSPESEDACKYWESKNIEGIILVGANELPSWAIQCKKNNPQWRLMRPTGRAAPSMFAD